MRILVTNDDGIYSPGLRALAEVATAFGEVRVVAPDVEQSAMGHAITILRPLRYQKAPMGGLEAYRVNGTPADCVALGTHRWEQIDLVLSGINLGSNLGHEIWHSGTVAAAKQAALLGVPAIAFSASTNGREPDLEALKPWVGRVLEALLREPKPFLLNVNFPPSPKGMLWTRQSVRRYTGRVILGADPMGREHFWFAAEPDHAPEEGTDRWAVNQGFIALTPLRLDLTDEERLSRAFQLAALAD
ncbi:5'-nucleotidase SurE [Meiothermus luteus]|uniref:5'-nucleotidase SurE n=1 Tax=Meiothermus luteus TaxID=2026184 RepID=A0A399EWV7_9DEIN|nr:5'/3'-nucleotidase SurE [Meiothermus luteus]RIH87579.1 5'-nucleotidase SurE [Meiothermus luteus]RMH58015.1 MAG: 5'/3'-nucleotidase SurE [Deinococcota bacterium]